MSDQFTINISGIDDVCKNLTDMPQRLVKGAYGKALAAAAIPVITELEPRVPVHTGLLKESIVTDIFINSEGKGGNIKVGFYGNSKTGDQGYIARMVEYGHRMVGPKPKSVSWKRFREENHNRLGDVEPHPFMRPAAAASADAAIAAFGQSIEQSMNEDKI